MLSVYPILSWWLREYIALSYYHHQIGSMNYYPLFKVRSWNNGMRRMSLYILTAALMYVYTGDSVPNCEPNSELQPTIVYRNECFAIPTDASGLTWIKLVIARPGIRYLIVAFEGREVSCSPVRGISVLVRYSDGNYGSCVALKDQQTAGKTKCTYRCRCVENCVDVNIGTRGIYQREICNLSYTMN